MYCFDLLRVPPDTYHQYKVGMYTTISPARRRALPARLVVASELAARISVPWGEAQPPNRQECRLIFYPHRTARRRSADSLGQGSLGLSDSASGPAGACRQLCAKQFPSNKFRAPGASAPEFVRRFTALLT